MPPASNASVYELAPLEEVTVELFHKSFNLNVLGLLLTTKEAVKRMGPEGGSVINIGSLASALRPPNSTVYAATKAAVEAITGVLAKELGPRKIRVNSISPGMIETEGGAYHELLRQRLPENGRRWVAGARNRLPTRTPGARST
jgi:3-oxoacyl-[acyl-carrier protein] reductase